jgi:hypothetical protein
MVVGSKNIKQKEKISENPDENIHCLPVGKSRSQEQADRMRQNRFAGYDGDLKMLELKGYRITSTTEVLPTGDAETLFFTSDELKKQQQQGRYTRWH